MKKILLVLMCLLLTAPAFAKKDKQYKKQKSLPPGLQKKLDRGGELPPGWQKKVAAGEVLSEDLYERAQPLPYSQYSRYSIYPPEQGEKILRLENRILRIKDDTREILQIFGIETGK